MIRGQNFAWRVSRVEIVIKRVGWMEVKKIRKSEVCVKDGGGEQSGRVDIREGKEQCER